MLSELALKRKNYRNRERLREQQEMAEERADRKVELLMQSVKKTRKRRRVKEEDDDEDMTKLVVSCVCAFSFFASYSMHHFLKSAFEAT